MPFFFLLLLRFLSSSSWNWLIDVSSPLSSKILFQEESKHKVFQRSSFPRKTHLRKGEEKSETYLLLPVSFSPFFSDQVTFFFPNRKKKKLSNLKTKMHFPPSTSSSFLFFFSSSFCIPLRFPNPEKGGGNSCANNRGLGDIWVKSLFWFTNATAGVSPPLLSHKEQHRQNSTVIYFKQFQYLNWWHQIVRNIYFTWKRNLWDLCFLYRGQRRGAGPRKKKSRICYFFPRKLDMSPGNLPTHFVSSRVPAREMSPPPLLPTWIEIPFPYKVFLPGGIKEPFSLFPIYGSCSYWTFFPNFSLCLTGEIFFERPPDDAPEAPISQFRE